MIIPSKIEMKENMLVRSAITLFSPKFRFPGEFKYSLPLTIFQYDSGRQGHGLTARVYPLRVSACPTGTMAGVIPTTPNNFWFYLAVFLGQANQKSDPSPNQAKGRLFNKSSICSSAGKAPYLHRHPQPAGDK